MINPLHSASTQGDILGTLVARRKDLIDPSTKGVSADAIDSAARQVLENSLTTEVSTVNLESSLAANPIVHLKPVVDLMHEREAIRDGLVAAGIDPTKAKYIAVGKIRAKANDAVAEMEQTVDSEIVEEGTKDKPVDESSDGTKEVVEEVEETTVDPISGESVTTVKKVVKRVKVSAAKSITPELEAPAMPSQVTMEKGQNVDIRV